MDATTNVLQLPHLRPTSIAIIMFFIRKKKKRKHNVSLAKLIAIAIPILQKKR
jgi:hypothetical protein